VHVHGVPIPKLNCGSIPRWENNSCAILPQGDAAKAYDLFEYLTSVTSATPKIRTLHVLIQTDSIVRNGKSDL
jgi:hypothetical protein